MRGILRYFLLSAALAIGATALQAQSNRWRDIHTVKKNETLYSISRDYGLTIDELVAANPEMRKPGYNLKKGSTVFVPYARQTAQPPVASKPAAKAVADDVRHRSIRVGVMLPLHDENGDGRRMVEYYRGVLMACDSLKKEGISTEVHAWNTAEGDNLASVLADPAAARCDIIIGPLYSKQVAALAKFVEKHDIMLMIPFSIVAPELYSNQHIFQVYQNQNSLSESTVRRFCEWFKDSHPVIVDCGDAESTKGQFTSSLRRQMDQRGMSYSLTSLSSSDDNFRKAFDVSKRNVVVLNTARSPELNAAIGKLSSVSAAVPEVRIALFGYTEWLMYAGHQLENFFRYDTYIPSHFYTNLLSEATERFQQKYRWNFHQDMMQSLPRFALTGFDHAMFFLRGLHQYGKGFDGASGHSAHTPVQTPLKFERVGNGGMQNRAYMFVHYLPEHRIETVNY